MVKLKINQIPQNNTLPAKLSSRLDMPNRYTGRISTGVEVKIPSTHCLRVALVPEIACRGLIMTTSGRITGGEVVVDVLNAGREIVSIKDGDPLVEVWVEKLEKFIWETE